MTFKTFIIFFTLIFLSACGDPPAELTNQKEGKSDSLKSDIKRFQKNDGSYNFCLGGSKDDDGKVIKVNQTLILIDLTDELRSSQIQYVEDNYINNLEWNSVGDSFGLARITNQAPEEMKIISLCAPDPIEKNNSQINKGNVKKFKKTFSSVFDQLLSPNGLVADNSMLIEGIKQVFTSNRYNFLAKNGPRHLIFVSDLYQNSSEISFYECNVNNEECSFQNTKKNKKSWFDAASLNLNKDDKITIYHLSAECNANLKIKDWWIAYFESEGAGEVNVISELGNNECKQKVVEVPKIKEKIIEKEVVVEVPKIKEKIIEKEVEVEKEIIIEVPVEKIIEKKVEVPVEKIIEKRVEVPVIKQKEVIVCSGKSHAGPNTFQKDIFCD